MNPTPTDWRGELQRLLAGLGRLEARGLPGTVDEVDALRALHDGLRDVELGAARSQWLDAGDRLSVQEDLARAEASRGGGALGVEVAAGGETPPSPSPGGAVGSVEQRLDLLAASCARVVRLRLREPAAPLIQGSEPLVGRDLRRQLASALQRAQAEGPGEVLELVGDPRWHGLVGPAGYGDMLEVAESYGRALGDEPRVVRFLERGRRAEALAAAYTAAVRQAEEACARGERQRALDALAARAHQDDPWFAATRGYLSGPESPFGGEQPGAAPTGATTDTPAAALDPDFAWRERLAAALEQEPAPARTEALAGALEDAQAEARADLAAARAVLDDLQPARKALRAVEELAPPLERVDRVYFELARAEASGPATFGALGAWCQSRGHKAWLEQLRPFLAGIPARADARERERRKRAQALDAVAGFMQTRLRRLEADLRGLVGWMREAGYAPAEARAELEALIGRALEASGAEAESAALRAELARLEHTALDDEARKLGKTFTRELGLVVRRARKATGEAVEACLDVGENGLAFDVFSFALLLDPDDAQARKALGQVRAGGTWMRPFRARQLEQGLAWDSERGWVVAKQRAKYAGGRHFDLQRQSWGELAELDRAHASPDDPWVIETEHFQVHATAPLARAAKACEVLEEFYLALFRLYEPFFAGSGARQVFGSAAVLQGRLTVWIYKDAEQYRAHSQCPAGTAGYYSPTRDTSYFYDDPADVWSTLRHETTHHVLAEASANERNGRHTWLSEGAAVFVEHAYRRPDGVLTAGGIEDNAWVRTFAKGLVKGEELSVPETVALQSSDQWDAAKPGGYRAAGGLVHFLCQMDDGRYRKDVVDMIRDAYNAKAVTLEAYTGLSPEVIDGYLRHFYTQRAPR